MKIKKSRRTPGWQPETWSPVNRNAESLVTLLQFLESTYHHLGCFFAHHNFKIQLIQYLPSACAARSGNADHVTIEQCSHVPGVLNLPNGSQIPLMFEEGGGKIC